ncbi:MAG: proprotein convertase P-domain-containing protein, partial [Myxococcota bacterium]|nr:proprotein convertase P-domain-containing protein [Myxococcota bacterium]
GGFSGSTALSFPSLPVGLSGSFSSTPVIPTAQSTATLIAGTDLVYNDYTAEILATPTGADSKSLNLGLSVNTLIPTAPELLVPVDGATNVSTTGYFDWNPTYQASNYVLEVDDDPSFSSVNLTASGPGTAHVAASPLAAATTYYWRVTTSNACGEVKTAARSFTTSTSDSFCSSPNLLFSSSGSVSDDLVIPQPGAIVSMDVSLDVSHTWVGDVQLSLTHQETTTSVLLVDRPGHPALGNFGCSSNNFLTTLADSGSAPVESQCASPPPAVAGMLTPDNPLAAFNGEDLAGTWTLLAVDAVAGDAGVINQWCILPSQVPEPGSVLLLVSGILFMCGERNIRGRRQQGKG